MSDIIKYEDWPDGAKVTTAFSNKDYTNTKYTGSKVFVWVMLAIGTMELIYGLTFSKEGITSSLLEATFYILIGLFMIWEGNSRKWIQENSSWEERFANKSSIYHKLIYLMISAALIGLLILKVLR